MELNDLFRKENIEPAQVLVLRHRPFELRLRKVLPWLAAERPDVFNAYQQTQGARVEAAMTKARFVASFIGHKSGMAVFIGLYKIGASKPLSLDEYWSVKAYKEMKAYDMRGFIGDRPSILWFNLDVTDFYSLWKGKLIVEWPGLERSWWRWADRNVLRINAIHEVSLLDAAMPPWDELVLSWAELQALPAAWRTALSHWRGIYHIFDASDGMSYVGSAYGSDNILSRWVTYAKSGHGDNVRLRPRAAENFRFSILQRVSPDLEPEAVIRLERTWKDRLHTREFGLNAN